MMNDNKAEYEKEFKKEYRINIRKSTKNSLMIAFVLFIIGAGCCLAAFCMGFTINDFRQFQFRIRDTGTGLTEFTERYADVEQLELDLGIIECKIIPWKEDEIEIRGENLPEKFFCEQSGEELEIWCQDDAAGLWKKNSTSFLEIYVPEDLVFDEVRIDAGVGTVNTQDGMIRCGVLKLDSGVGACRISADILEKAEIESGIGEVVLVLPDNEDDYNYDLECGVGTIRIGDLEISGPGQDWKKDNDARKKIEAECGIGALKIEFSE